MNRYIQPAQFQRIFEALPGAFILVLPDAGFTIVGVSDEYLRATLRRRAEVTGRPLFSVFPDNPETPDANSTFNLSRSLQRVVATRAADVMAVQRYDVQMRYWSPVNAPVFDEDGAMLCIIHRVDNVTDYIRLSEAHERQSIVSEQLSAETNKMKADIVENAQHAARDLFERRRLTLATRIAPAGFCACGDATRLEQALANLLTNAAKYSEPGANVELSLEPLAAEPGWARIVVRDVDLPLAPAAA